MADQILQEIKDRLNVADVIADYIPVKKAGTNFRAVCPFHSEKTPSLMISPQKQIWHCFGCGEGGDVFGFVMRYENLDFKETLKLLAGKAGVQLPQFRPRDPKEETEKELLFRINDFSARYYHQILVKDKRGAEALNYLKDRGLSLPTIGQWQIGFAPDGFHGLEQALAKKNIGQELLLKAGVSAKNERGQIYDRFRGRVTFPIFDYQGRAVGFSARILQTDERSAKYINSPETLIYQKSKILFGLNFAKTAIRKQDEAIIVEGQMDCIAVQQAGFGNIVASSGTALTSEQLGLLGRLTKNLKFCFDADTAGQAASRRAGELALKQGFRLKVIVLDKVKDPDELIKRSPGLWEKAVAEAEWFLDWQMNFAQRQLAQDPVEQKHWLSQNILPLLGFVADPLEQDHYLRQMIDRFSISERVIREQMKQAAGGFKAAEPAAGGLPKAARPSNALEKEILGGILKFPEFLKQAAAAARPTDFEDQEIGTIISPIFEPGTGRSLDQSSVVAKEALFMVESLLELASNDEDIIKRQLQKDLSQLRLQGLKRRQTAVSLEIKLAEAGGQKERLPLLNRQLAEILSQRFFLEKQL